MPTKSGEAFEDVLYGSDSELTDDETPEARKTTQQKKPADFGARLRLNQDEPMDLLEGATNVISELI